MDDMRTIMHLANFPAKCREVHILLLKKDILSSTLKLRPKFVRGEGRDEFDSCFIEQALLPQA